MFKSIFGSGSATHVTCWISLGSLFRKTYQKASKRQYQEEFEEEEEEKKEERIKLRMCPSGGVKEKKKVVFIGQLIHE